MTKQKLKPFETLTTKEKLDVLFGGLRQVDETTLKILKLCEEKEEDSKAKDDMEKNDSKDQKRNDTMYPVVGLDSEPYDPKN